MAVTRIKNNQITDSTITGAKMVSNTITSGLLEDDLTYGSNFTVSGNLTVNGTTTTVDTTNTLIADPLFVLSRGETGTPSADSGIVIERGTSTNVAFIWDESADTFTVVNTTEDGSTAGDVTIASYADFKAGAMSLESIAIDNITIDGNSITSTDTNGNIALTPNGTGEVVLATAVVSDLTATRVTFAGASGALTDSANMTFSGTLLDVTGGVTASGTVEGGTVTDGTASLASGSLTGAVNVTASGTVTGGTITDGTASLASGSITSAVNGTFSGTLTGGTVTDGTASLASGSLTSAVNVTASGTITGGTITDGTLSSTAGTVTGGVAATFSGAVTGGSITDGTATLASGALTGATTGAFSSNVTVGGTLGVTGEATLASATVSDLTATRITYAGASGSLVDSANLTFDGTNVAVTGGINVTGDLDVDNININGNAITSTDTNGDIDLTPNGTGEVVASTMSVSDLTDNRIVVAGTAGSLEDDANFTWDGSAMGVTGGVDITGDLDIDNIKIDGNTMSSTDTNGDINITPNGTGVTNIKNLQLTGLTADRILVTDSSGGTTTDDNLTWDGSDLGLTGALTVDNITVNGDTISSVHSEIIIDPSTAGSGGTVTIAGNLNVTGTTTTVDSTVVTIADPIFQLGGDSNDGLDRGVTALYNDGAAKTAFFGMDDSALEFVFIADATDASSVMSGSLGSAAFGSMRVTDLTSTRVLLAGTSGEIEDSGNLTFNGSTLAVTGAATVSTTLDVTGALTASSTLDVTGLASLDGGIDVDGAFTVANTSGNIDTTGTLDVDGLASLDGGIAVDDAFTVADTSGNVATTGTLSAGETTVTSATISDLTSGRIVLAGTAGAIEDSGNLTFNGSTLSVTGAVTATGAVTGASLTDGTATLASGSLTGAVNVTASGTVTGGSITDGTATLTGGSITGGVAATFSGAVEGGSITDGTATLASGSLTGAVNLTASGTITGGTLTDGTLSSTAGTITGGVAATFSGTITGGTLTDGTASFTAGALTGATTGAFSSNVTVGGTLGVTGEATLASATVSDLTSGRVVLAGTAGAIEDSGNFTFDGTTATITGAADIDNVGIDGNSITGTGNLILEASAASAIVVNEAGADVDFRVEGTGETNALFVEGSSGNVGIKTATPTAGASLHIDSTDSMIIPSGTTAQRPGVAAKGMTRFNSTLDKMEFYNGAEWLIAGADFTIITADSFDGDGSTVAFTISESSTTAGVIISINGVVQDPGTAYSVSGTTLTFTEAPESGDNVDARILTTTATIEGADSADKWSNARTITLGGDLTGSVSIDGSADVTLTATVVDDTHSHIIGDVDGLQSALDLKAPLASPTFTGTVSGVTAAMVGLGNVTNESKATMLSSPALTGTPTAPTAAANTNTTQVATTAYVQQEITDLVGGAPGALDTLNELAAAINDDASYASTTTTALGARLSSTATVTLSGDVTGTANFSGNVATISATIAANSVALGTDTTGNYVQQGATSGNGISGSVNSEGGTFTVTSNATSANTANTIVYRDASGNFSAGTITATATSAQYADLAENYTADAAYEPGTVVSFGGDAEVTANGADMDRRVAGVVSTDPAHLMNADCAGEHVVALALQGRVPCKVTGPVAKGDIMVAAGNGMARAEADPKVGTVIGKALEAHASGEGVIEVAVGRF